LAGDAHTGVAGGGVASLAGIRGGEAGGLSPTKGGANKRQQREQRAAVSAKHVSHTLSVFDYVDALDNPAVKQEKSLGIGSPKTGLDSIMNDQSFL
jgi:hypothetical protein